MGCALKKIRAGKESKVGSKFNHEKPAWLTADQKTLVKNSWQQLEMHIANVGVTAFVSMFESKPELLELFANFKEHGLHEIKKNGLLRQHALRVMATVDKSVLHIDEPEYFAELLRDIGLGHLMYKVPSENIKIIMPHFFSAIKPHIEEFWSDDMADAWKSFFALIIYYMEDGMTNIDIDNGKLSKTFTVT